MGLLNLTDERRGNVVVVGARQNPKGAVLVLPGESDGQVQTFALSDAVGLMHPSQVIDILCIQERAFGQSGLTPPCEPSGTT